LKAEKPATSSGAPWAVWVDTGGTFTDCIARDPSGQVHRVKVLSSSALRGTLLEVVGKRRLRVELKWSLPDGFLIGFAFRTLGTSQASTRDGEAPRVSSYEAATGWLELDRPLPESTLLAGTPFEVLSPEEAPTLATRLVTATPGHQMLPPVNLRLATTRGTNALLERRGVPPALFVTAGFGDVLEIGTQARPDLFALDVRRPEPLHGAVVEVRERIATDGAVVEALVIEPVREAAVRLFEGGMRVAAVAFLNSFRNPKHEQELADLLREVGFEHVSTSATLAPSIQLLPRAQTAVANAYLAPVIEHYLDRVQAAYESPAAARAGPTTRRRKSPSVAPEVRVMTSAGGLVPAASFAPKDSLLSGPAGGVAGAAFAGRRSGVEHIIAFDMGGTSTDVARYGGDFEYVFEHTIGDAHLVAPALAIESVAAGGGSICGFDGRRLFVGPESAGAWPGPAAYGAGGPLTVTDVNLLLGRLDPERFELPLDTEASRRRLRELRDELRKKTGECSTDETLLVGFLDVANERMADAIRRVSVRRGYDPQEYTLVSFGGAGGQHACAVASRLRMTCVIVPQDAGLLSALGLGHAVLERFEESQVLKPLSEIEANLEKRFLELETEARQALLTDGVPHQDTTVRLRLLHLRLAGQDATVEVEYPSGTPVVEAFRRRYREIYGHEIEDSELDRQPVEVESVRVVVSSASEPPRGPETRASSGAEGPPPSTQVTTQSRLRAFFDGSWQNVPAHDRTQLEPGATFEGPAFVLEAHSATWIEPGWRAVVDSAQNLVLRREARPPPTTPSNASKSEAVRLELFTHRFAHIAAEMGEMLRRTAVSTNVKERLDFSCALLDPRGDLVVNAPHIPVHLGALGLCVRRTRTRLALEPGDVIVTNHPAFGGSHLPDVTVITPVFTPEGEPLGHVASRAHHAEIGGSRPGSMPPAATRLFEEGVVIEPRYLVRRGIPRWEEVRDLLSAGPYPSRAVTENLADLHAAVAANQRGAHALQELAATHGHETILEYMAKLESHAERHLRDALTRLPDGLRHAREELDDGTVLEVQVLIEGDRATIDFSGTSTTHPGNLNATPAIVQSVVIYVLRLLVAEPLPLNEGLLRPVELRLPEGILNPVFPPNPEAAPAVVGGNVETSQRLAGTLLKALGVVASSQGTMNNVLFGTEAFGYYETVGGGCGAGPDFDGASAVHSHMTNTRITDPEIIEHRYPVRVIRFARRRGSGGRGHHRGGDGIVRELEFLAPVALSVLTQHRTRGPYGMAGGEPGKPGLQKVVRAGGEEIVLGSQDSCEMEAGDHFVLETPVGGGYGSPH